jgi:4'-phosphopantetheinyl transferase
LLQPNPQILHLWQAQFSRDKLTQYIAVLSPDEKIRAAQFVFDRHRERFIWARGTLRYLLARYCRMTPAMLTFSYSSYGKPDITQEQNPTQLTFNLSHSGDRAIYAVTSSRAIGVDIEQIRPSIKVQDIAQHYFSLPEQKALLALPTSEQIPAFFRLWAAKEAFIKAVGQGLSYPLDSFCIDISDKNQGLLSLQGSIQAAQSWQVQHINTLPGYKAAFAIDIPR